MLPALPDRYWNLEGGLYCISLFPHVELPSEHLRLELLNVSKSQKLRIQFSARGLCWQLIGLLGLIPCQVGLNLKLQLQHRTCPRHHPFLA